MSTNTGDQEQGEPVFTSVSQFRVPTADELRQLRILTQTSQRDVADAIGVDKDTIRRWERGDTDPGISDARELLEFYAEAAEGQTRFG